MTRALVFSPDDDRCLELISAASVATGGGLDGVDLLLAGPAGEERLRTPSSTGVGRIVVAEWSDPTDAFSVDRALRAWIGRERPDYVLLTSDRIGRQVAGGLAQLLGGGASTEVVGLESAGGSLTVKRMVLGGKGIASEEVDTPAVLAIQPGRFPPAEASGTAGGAAEVVRLEDPGADHRVRIVERRPRERSGVRLEDAEVVVVAGRGFERREDLRLAFELAEALGGAVGATRPLVADLGWLPGSDWIGISGVRISPRLMVAVGVSGQMQFLAGALDSKVIVAVNKDPNAPIVGASDYAVVADLYEFLPALIEVLRGGR